MKDTYENFIAYLRESIDSRVEYETGHPDAGDAYAYLPREGSFDHYDGEKRLAEYLAEQEITLPEGVDFSALVDFVLDSFEMREGHMFGPYGRSGDFHVDSFPVGEVEIAFDLSALVDQFGPFARGFWLKAQKDSEFCLRGDMSHGQWAQGYAYESTDAVWYATISPESIREWIAEQVTEIENAA